jgi:hypothetical protein
MIAVEVTNRHEINVVSVQAKRLEREQRRGSAVKQKSSVVRFDKIAALTPTAVAECITSTKNRNTHEQSCA